MSVGDQANDNNIKMAQVKNNAIAPEIVTTGTSNVNLSVSNNEAAAKSEPSPPPAYTYQSHASPNDPQPVCE